MANILTTEQVRTALYLDDDFDVEELERYAQVASSFLKNKTGYDFAQDNPIEPLAIQCAMMYIRQLHFGSEGYNKTHDYSIGLISLIVDLQVIADEKNQSY